MEKRWVRYACRAYSGLVTAVTLFCIAAVAGGSLPRRHIRGYELAVERAENVAVLSALMAILIGCSICAACLLSKADPPALLLRRTLAAMLVFAFVLLFLPALVVP